MSMSAAERASDSDTRRRYAHVFGASADEARTAPVEQLRALLVSVDEQLDTYVELGFLTPSEADEAGGVALPGIMTA